MIITPQNKSSFTSDTFHSLLDSGSLRIPSVLTSDAANYKCTASNDAGSSDREITLNVQGESHFIRPDDISYKLVYSSS